MTFDSTSTSPERISARQATAQRWANTVHSAIAAHHLAGASYRISTAWDRDPIVQVECGNLAEARDLAAVLAGAGPVGENIEDGRTSRRHALVVYATPVLIVWHTQHPATLPIQSRGGGRAGERQPASTIPPHALDGAA